MDLSIAILCHNYGRFLRKAIDSCIQQSSYAQQFEIIVIDDGSTDNTPEICAEYTSHIRTLRYEQSGFGASLTRAIQESEGEYVCLLDADDYFSREKLISLTPAMATGMPFIWHDQHFINEQGEAITNEVAPGGNTSTLCLNRKAAMTLLPVENELSFHAIRLAGKGIHVPAALTNYRKHSGGRSRNPVPGKHNLHRSDYTNRLAAQLATASLGKFPWLDSLAQAKDISIQFRTQARYNELEARLECKEWRLALIACAKMLNEARARSCGLTRFELRMIAKTLLCRPSFPKPHNGHTL